jgi:ABC-type glycerol-3-phosphate transport system substrate-binding protein
MSQLHVLLKHGHTVEAIQKLKHEFENEHGVEVFCEVVGEDEAYHRLISAVDLPDVCTVPYWYLPELVEASVLEPMSMEDLETTHHPIANEALSISGQQFAVPHTLVGSAFFYRKDRLGTISQQTLGSLDLLLNYLEEIVVSGESFGLRTSQHFSTAETYRGLAFPEGTDLFRDLMADRTGWLSPAGNRFVELLEKQRVDVSNCGYAEVGELFMSGRLSLMFDTSAWSTIFSKNPEFFELVEVAQIGLQPKAQFFYAEGLGIVSGSSNRGLAKEFVMWRQSERIVSYEISELNRLDFPRSDLNRFESFAIATSTNAGARVRDEIEKSWESIESSYPVQTAGYVPWATNFSTALSKRLIENRAG